MWRPHQGLGDPGIEPVEGRVEIGVRPGPCQGGGGSPPDHVEQGDGSQRPDEEADRGDEVEPASGLENALQGRRSGIVAILKRSFCFFRAGLGEETWVSCI